MALALGSVLSVAGVALAADGKIAGHVYIEGTTTPIPSATVYAYHWDADLSLGQVIAAGTGFTDENGSYTVSGLASGTYRVRAEADGYFSQYYNGDTTPGSAEEVLVTDPNTTSGIDFALGEGGSLSGSVYQADGTTPIIGAHVIAYDSTSGQMVDDAWTSDNGTYTVGNNMYPGSYKVKAEADGYFSEYYDNVTDSASATPVEVTVSNDTPDVNFTLAEGGSISGLVQTDNGTPIYGAHVIAYDTSDQMVDDAWTSDDGSYTVGNNIPPGDYKVGVDADGFFSQYYNNKPDSASADLVTITGTSKVQDVNFGLAPGGSIRGFVWEEGGATPINGARVMAFDNVTAELVDEAWSRVDGSYVLGNNIDTGSYILQAEADGYFSRYYDNVTDIALATPVAVTAPDEITGKNFTLSAQTLQFTNVSASDIGENTATITWTTDQPGTSQVEYGTTVQYGSSTTLDENLLTSHTVNLAGLTRATTYHYRVKSKDALGRESHSDDFTFTTPDTTPPVISDVAASNTTATEATITWTTDEPAESQVEYGTTASYGQITTLDTNLVINHSVVLTGLTSGTTYHYMVKSRDTQGSGTWSQLGGFTFNTLDNTLDITPPGISAVTASGMTQTGATITWTTSEAATSQVEYGPTDQYGSATTLDATLATGHSVSLTGLTAGTTYHFRVKSKDASNNEAVSADYTFATTAPPVPDTTPPTTPVVSDGGDSTTNLTQLHATWTSSDAESGVAEYQYAIGTSAGGTDVVDWTSAGTGTSVTRTGLSLSVGSTYYFSVKARNGEGLWSAVGSSNGILVVQDEIPEEPSEDGGMPTWAWIVIGLGGAAAIGGIGYWLIKGMPKQPQQ
jgi:5-hydroxyisourate hydrolase-like protein (transthyretin family)